jgi:glycosyltransferase involved in cell wall biosynthesis
VIAGQGELRGSLTAEIARLGLADRVHLLGYVEAADALIRESDVFVMSSKEEGLGSVILNALALGKPVVATAAGGIPEILPGEALVPVGDAAGLAGKVVQALDHPSPVPLPVQFTASAMAQGVLALYRSLL